MINIAKKRQKNGTMLQTVSVIWRAKLRVFSELRISKDNEYPQQLHQKDGSEEIAVISQERHSKEAVKRGRKEDEFSFQ